MVSNIHNLSMRVDINISPAQNDEKSSPLESSQWQAVLVSLHDLSCWHKVEQRSTERLCLACDFLKGQAYSPCVGNSRTIDAQEHRALVSCVANSVAMMSLEMYESRRYWHYGGLPRKGSVRASCLEVNGVLSRSSIRPDDDF